MGAPTINTLLMVSFHFLKYQHNPSDDEAAETSWENCYSQILSGIQVFSHHASIDSSCVIRRTTHVGQIVAESRLKTAIHEGIKLRAIQPSNLSRLNLDTTGQTNASWNPTDPRLNDRARERFLKAACEEGFQVK
jgi:IS5 family transposase